MSHPPLPPIRVLLTRPAEQSLVWARLLEAAGAVPVVFPTIFVGPPPSWQALDESLRNLHNYDWVLFSSASAVKFTVGRLTGAQSLSPLKVAAVGKETAQALEKAGIPVDVVPPNGEDQRGTGLAAALGFLTRGTRVLFPQAIGGRPELSDALTARGCVVHVVPASQTTPVTAADPVPPFDVATFASPSAFRAFVGLGGVPTLAGKPVVVLGETTAAAVRAVGIVPFVSDAPHGQAMIAAIARSLNA